MYIYIFYFCYRAILFQDTAYDKAKGETFLETCFKLQPSHRPPRLSSPISSWKVIKNPQKFDWPNLANSLIDTYDYLLNEEAKVIKFAY